MVAAKRDGELMDWGEPAWYNHENYGAAEFRINAQDCSHWSTSVKGESKRNQEEAAAKEWTKGWYERLGLPMAKFLELDKIRQNLKNENDSELFSE